MLNQDTEIDLQDGVAVVTFAANEVTHEAMAEVSQSLLDHVRYDGTRRFVLDLTPVTYLASACLGVLVGFLQEVELTRGRLALAGCSKDVLFLFKVTRLDSVFPIYDDVEDALAGLADE